MAGLSASQIIALAAQDAKVPGFTHQAGEIMNMVLSELCETYDFDAAKGTTVFNFNPSQITTNLYPNVTPGGGPYALPADFLRMIDNKDAVWYLNGVPYPMIPCDLSEYDNFVQQAGLQSYPLIFATDMSQAPPNGPNANLLVWPPASGNYKCLIRYRRLMPDIATPETSAVVPWFPFQSYLRRRIAGELMGLSGDDRMDTWLGESPTGAQGMLKRYLLLKDDSTDRPQTVKLDRRRFGNGYNTLPNSKVVGW